MLPKWRSLIQILLKFFPKCGEIFGTAKITSGNFGLNENASLHGTLRGTKKSPLRIQSNFFTINMSWNVGNSRNQPRPVNSINQATTAGASAIATDVFSASATILLANILLTSQRVSWGLFTISQPLVVMENQRWCSVEMCALQNLPKLPYWH